MPQKPNVKRYTLGEIVQRLDEQDKKIDKINGEIKKLKGKE